MMLSLVPRSPRQPGCVLASRRLGVSWAHERCLISNSLARACGECPRITSLRVGGGGNKAAVTVTLNVTVEHVTRHGRQRSPRAEVRKARRRDKEASQMSFTLTHLDGRQHLPESWWIAKESWQRFTSPMINEQVTAPKPPLAPQLHCLCFWFCMWAALPC